MKKQNKFYTAFWSYLIFTAFCLMTIVGSFSFAQYQAPINSPNANQENWPTWIKRELTSKVQIRDLYTSFTSAFLLADLVTSAGPSGTVLLWIPDLNIPKAYIIDGKNNPYLNKLLNQNPIPQPSSLSYLTTAEKKIRLDWHSYYQNWDSQNQFYDLLNPRTPLDEAFPETAIFNPDHNLSLYEIAVNLDYRTSLIKLPQYPNSLFFHSHELIGDHTRKEFSSDSSSNNYHFALSKIKSYLNQNSIEIYSSPLESELHPHIQFFSSSSPSGIKEQLALVSYLINKQWYGVALHYDNFSPKHLPPMTFQKVSELSLNTLSGNYELDGKTLKSFDPSSQTYNPTIETFGVTSPINSPLISHPIPSIQFYLTSNQSGFKLNNQYFTPSLDSQHQFSEFNRWFLTFEARSNATYSDPNSIFSPIRDLLDKRSREIMPDENFKSKTHPYHFFRSLKLIYQSHDRNLLTQVLGRTHPLNCQSILSIP